MNTRQLSIVAAIIVVVLLIFQLFMRYVYLAPDRYGRVMRVDRLSGISCYVPCTPAPPTPPPTPTPTPTPAPTQTPLEEREQDAIAMAKVSDEARSVLATGSHEGYQWSAKPALEAVSTTYMKADCPGTLPGATPWPKPMPSDMMKAFGDAVFKCVPLDTFLVSFGDKNGLGWFWEVHLNSKRIYFVSDNRDLSSKYGLMSHTP